MPLNMNNPVIVSEKTPSTLHSLGESLCVLCNVPFGNYGIKGDASHTCGYHRSHRTLTQVPGTCGWEDYSIQDSRDKDGIDIDDCSALDFTPGTPYMMTTLTSRLHQAALAHDPRLYALRRIVGTLDGQHVFSFNADTGQPSGSFDNSHLWHLHLEFWRSRVRMDHTGIYQIMAGGDLGMKMILVAEVGSSQVYLSNLMEKRLVKSNADLEEIRRQAGPGAFWDGDIWQRGTIHSVAAGVFADGSSWGVDISGGPGEVTLDLTPEMLEEIRDVVDEELDEQSRSGADDD